MLDKVVLGTANFVKPYGILSQGHSVLPHEVNSIVKQARLCGLRGFDTAIGYGDIFEIVPRKNFHGFDIITKVSALEAPENIIKILKDQRQNFHGILIHDPQNILKFSKVEIIHWIKTLKAEFSSTKIGISVYDISEVLEFSRIYLPEIIQIPLNPLNQRFRSADFITFTQENDIEVHARSLFLQGILLSNELPKNLLPLTPYHDSLKQRIGTKFSILSALLRWARAHAWINAWILGVSSVNNLRDIINVLTQDMLGSDLNPLESFPAVDHPLVDPQNWTSVL